MAFKTGTGNSDCCCFRAYTNVWFSLFDVFNKKLNKRVVKNYTACVGKTAKAYTAFHPEGDGQIEVEVNGRLSIEKSCKYYPRRD